MVGIEPLAAEYFPLVATWLSQAEINQWLTSEWRGRTIDPSLIGIAVRNKRNRLFLARADDVPCGLVALAEWDIVDKIAMIWYVLGDPASGGRGVITQSVRELVHTSFETLGIEALHAWIIEGNERSRRVLEKNGFREAGRLRLSVVHDGARCDRIYFDLPREKSGS